MLLTLCTLLCNDPLLNEPGVVKEHVDMNSYNEIIYFANINIAVCDIIQKKTGVFMPFFDNFYPFIKENFIKNYDKMLEFCDKKRALDDFKKKTIIKTGFYNLIVNVDYAKIIEKIKECRILIETM